jgi:IS30 family transposase
MYQHLSHKDRVAIGTLREAAHSVIEIAAQLRVHRSTIARELKRNGTILTLMFSRRFFPWRVGVAPDFV